MTMPLTLKEGEHVLTAYAEPASGPGWANYPLWVLIRNMNNEVRVECLQPDEQGNPILDMYDWSALAHKKMTAAVNRLIASSRNGSKKKARNA